jgi:hypothetical protein
VTDRRRLLILTLSSGEAALPALTRQLRTQTFQDFDHEIISGLPNQAAHNRLYRTIMDRASAYDLFLKLDADMTLRTETSLADAVGAADRHPLAHHFAFRVWDCFTEEETLGVHLFRAGVRWPQVSDDLFVDPDPPGVTQILWEGAPAPFVNHGEVVSDFECFSFGVHKFLKVAQRGRTPGSRAYKSHKYFRHMRSCARIRDLYRATHARRHQLALTGLLWAMAQAELSSMASKSDLQRAYETEVRPHESKWQRDVDRLSRNLVAWRFALLKSLGARRAFAEIGV